MARELEPVARNTADQGHKGTLKVHLGAVRAAKDSTTVPAAPPPPQDTAVPKWAWVVLACSVAFSVVVVVVVLVVHAGRTGHDVPAAAHPAAGPAAGPSPDTGLSESWSRHEQQLDALLRQSEARIQRWTALRSELDTRPAAVQNELSMAAFRCDATLTNLQAQLRSLQQSTADALPEINPGGRHFTRRAAPRVLELSGARERLEASSQRADELLDTIARQLRDAEAP